LPLFTEVPGETVRKGVRVASEVSIFVVCSSEIELLGTVSSVFEASVQSLSGLFGQSLEGEFPELRLYEVLGSSRRAWDDGILL
jgi:hypothetical protein